MTTVNKNISTQRMLASLDWAEVSEVPLEEVSKELELLGKNPEKIIENVHRKVSHLRQNASIARTMNFESAHVKRRLLLIGLIGLFGILGACVSIYVIATGSFSGEPAKLLSSALVVGFTGIFVAAAAAFTNVIWSAFIYQTILAKAAQHEADLAKAAQREADILVKAIEDVYMNDRSIADLLHKYCIKYPAIKHWLSQVCHVD